MASCIIFLFLFLFPVVSVTAQHSGSRNVTLGSSIVAKADASPSWTSPSGEFALGFRQVAPGAFLLGIWFDRVPEKTLVWSANREAPVPPGSTVQLSADGALELIDKRSRRVWQAQAQSGAAAAYGAMLDTGSFVLASNASEILWRSFDEPTDTLLPGQILSGSSVLVSSFSETNYSRGKFMLEIDGENVELHIRNFPLDTSIHEYWSGSGSQLIFNQSGNVYTASGNGSDTMDLGLDSEAVPVGDYLQRLTLGYDGVLRRHVYPKSAAGGGAWSVHDYIPSDICMGVKTAGNGGGICGFNSLCLLGPGTDGRVICQCPKGYSWIDPANQMGGCKPDFVAQSCNPESRDASADLFELSESFNIDWAYDNYRELHHVDEDFCRRHCLADCFCGLAIYANGGCYTKPLPLINGRTDPSSGYKTLLKIRKNSTATLDAPTPTGLHLHAASHSSSAIFIAGAALMAASFLVFLVSSLLFCLSRRRSPPPAAGAGDEAHPIGLTTMKRFSFDELKEATDEFKDELGKGGFSIVYRGVLKDDGKLVAVKKLNGLGQESDFEFTAEVSSISRTNHRNLVQLLGYCNQGQHRILVYEFMPNGSVASFLFGSGSRRPSWYTRVEIAFATARGLFYLHHDCSVSIMHCDIKPENVLLDESFTPKIADFGIAKLLRPNQTKTTTNLVRGTMGYRAPEWFRNMAITVKVDVYSFGVLLLELLCCRKHLKVDAEDPEQVVLASWAYDCYKKGELCLLVEGDEEAKSHMKMFELYLTIAIWCIQQDPTLRPDMKRVMRMLEGSIQVTAPPDPSIFIS